MLLTAGFLSRFYVSSREETIVGKVARLLLDEEVREVRQLAVRTCESLGHREVLVPTSAVVEVKDLVYVTRLSLPARLFISRRRRRAHSPATERRRVSAPPLTAPTPCDARLLGANEVIGSYVRTADGWAGHVEDLLIDGGTWAVSHIIIDTVNWWPGKKVMAPREWLAEVDTVQRVLRVTRTRAEVRDCAVFDPNVSVSLRKPAVT